MIWIFIWDDTIDTNEEALSQDFDGSCRFREQSLAYIRHCLGLPQKPTLQQSMLSRVGRRFLGPLPTWVLNYWPDMGGFLPRLTDIRPWLHPQPEPTCPNDACSIFREFAHRATQTWDESRLPSSGTGLGLEANYSLL